jgi:hypothetical protein
VISVDVKRNQSAIFLLLRNQYCFSLAEGLRLTDQLPFEMAKANEPEMIPIRATIISAIFVIPYVVILRVFQGKTNSISAIRLCPLGIKNNLSKLKDQFFKIYFHFNFL